jgi:cell division protein FtsW (lipid II flippase)
MKQRFLFPYWSRYVGYACILVHIPLMAAKHFETDSHFPASSGGHETYGDHLYFAIAFLLMVVGLILVAFSKEKIEDEQISRLRLDSLQWAIYLNYAILIVSLIATDKMGNHFILAIDTWVPLLFFIVRFRWEIIRLNLSMKSDQPS